jgi:hypothetical protein
MKSAEFRVTEVCSTGGTPARNFSLSAELKDRPRGGATAVKQPSSWMPLPPLGVSPSGGSGSGSRR